ncbi:hypothetical protein CsSME_00006646 [Camellia sinensis var. sinensis]
MVRPSMRLPGLCMNHGTVSVRVHSPPPKSGQTYNSIDTTPPTKPSFRKCHGALQWALSHTVQCHDTLVLVLVLLHVTKQGGPSARADELLCSTKDTCQMRRPGVQVEIAMVEGKEKGPTKVEEAKKPRVSLLILGQRKRSPPKEDVDGEEDRCR